MLGGNVMKPYHRAARSLILTSLAISLAILLTPKVNRTQPSAHGTDMVLLQAPATFKQEVLDHNGAVVVDFYAPWCPACQTMMPTFQKMASDSQLKRQNIKFVAVNVEQFPEVADSIGFEAIPAFAFFKNGKQVGTVKMGAMQPDAFKKCVLEACKA